MTSTIRGEKYAHLEVDAVLLGLDWGEGGGLQVLKEDWLFVSDNFNLTTNTRKHTQQQKI